MPALVLLFKSPDYVFPPTVSFRLDTGNTNELTMTAAAHRLRGRRPGGGATSSAGVTLPAGGAATLDLALGPEAGLITPDTKTTDLAVETPSVAVLGAQPGAGNGLPPLSTLAICDVDGDKTGDFVIGAPQRRRPGRPDRRRRRLHRVRRPELDGDVDGVD